MSGIDNVDANIGIIASLAAHKISIRECNLPIDSLILANAVKKLVESLSRTNQ
jgi:hypothetical protein